MNDINEKIEKLIDQRSLDRGSPDPIRHNDQQVNFELQLQEKIDASLARTFLSTPAEESVHREKMETLISNSKLNERPNVAAPKVATLIWALAASVLLLIGFAIWLSNQGPSDPDYVRRQLATLYEDTVDRGFKPYYVCDDPDRFAAEFEKRQGVPLRLGKMPEHKQMVGISYIGGVSRKTTSMLGSVNGKPVLVFVDNLSDDDEQMRSQVGKHDGYHVSRATKDGLVFYEISEYEDAQLIEYFERVEP